MTSLTRNNCFSFLEFDKSLVFLPSRDDDAYILLILNLQDVYQPSIHLKMTISFLSAEKGFQRLRNQDFSGGKTNNLSSCCHTESMLDEFAKRSPATMSKSVPYNVGSLLVDLNQSGIKCNGTNFIIMKFYLVCILGFCLLS